MARPGDDLFDDESLATRRVAVETVFARLKSSLGLHWPGEIGGQATLGATVLVAHADVTAYADLRNPASDRIVTGADIRHDLSTGRGHADLAIEGLRFDPLLQPDDLSRLALGVVANARGIVTGAGRVDWGANGVTSSGQLTTDALDFAAAFGPVKGASGTIRFTDLLSLTTAPGQKLRVASINPGIEVLDGEVEDSDGHVYKQGDFASLRPGSKHFSISHTGCTVAVFIRGGFRTLDDGEPVHG